MMALLTARFGKASVIALGLAGLLAIAGLGAWRAMVRIDGMVERAASTARAERDAHWRAEIERSNAEVAAKRAEQAIAAAAADRAAQDEITRLQGRLTDLEKKNATLPNGGARGLGRDRVRLLND